MMGTGTIARAGVNQSYESPWIAFVMLVFVSVCMVTERGQWKTWHRIGFVFLAWILQAILTLPVLLTVGAFVHAGGRPDLVDRITAFLASLPIVVIAMRRSRLFVRGIPST